MSKSLFVQTATESGMTVTILNIETIVSDPNIRQGHPLLAGTHVTVSDVIASYLYRGFSPEELAVQFSLTLGQIHAALAYYYLHKAEIDDEIRRRTDEADILLDELDKQGKLTHIE